MNDRIMELAPGIQAEIGQQELLIPPDEAIARLYQEGKSNLLGGYAEVLNEITPELANGIISVPGAEGVDFGKEAAILEGMGIRDVKAEDESQLFPTIQ